MFQEMTNYLAQHPHTLILFKMALSALITFLLFITSGRFLHLIEKYLRKRTPWKFDEQVIAYLRIPLRHLILLIGAYFFFDSLSETLGENYQRYLDGVFYILIVIRITTGLTGLAGRAGKHISEELTERAFISGKEEFIPLGVRVIKILIFLVALIIALKHFNQNVESLIVSLGVGSLAIALAAQETLSNMIAGFVIMTDRPFSVGDRIQLSSGETGDVYEIGLRSTKILTFDNTLVIVPNAEIVKDRVTNLTYPDPATRVKVLVGVAYGSDLQKVKAILEKICRDNPRALKIPPPAAYFLNFGEFSLDFQVTCQVPTWNDEWRVAEEIRLEIDRRFREEGIEIPFPQRTLWWGQGQKPPSGA